MASTPYVTTETLLSAQDLSSTSIAAVPTDAATTSAYGYTEAQANAVITQMNLLITQNLAIIALLKAHGLVAES